METRSTDLFYFFGTSHFIPLISIYPFLRAPSPNPQEYKNKKPRWIPNHFFTIGPLQNGQILLQKGLFGFDRTKGGVGEVEKTGFHPKGIWNPLSFPGGFGDLRLWNSNSANQYGR